MTTAGSVKSIPSVRSVKSLGSATSIPTVESELSIQLSCTTNCPSVRPSPLPTHIALLLSAPVVICHLTIPTWHKLDTWRYTPILLVPPLSNIKPAEGSIGWPLNFDDETLSTNSSISDLYYPPFFNPLIGYSLFTHSYPPPLSSFTFSRARLLDSSLFCESEKWTTLR